MQWLGKHVPAAVYMYATIEVLLETGFSAWSMLSCYKQGTRLELGQLVCEEKTRRLCETAASLGASQLKVRLRRETFICAVVTEIFGVCNSVRLLQLQC
jgi:hypothetical protein